MKNVVICGGGTGDFQRHRHRASRLQALAHRVAPGALAFERELEPGSTFGAQGPIPSLRSR